MTRINAGIAPDELPDKLLLAEHREIKRIGNSIKSGRAIVVNLPERFTLGKGHVKFFYDKIYWLYCRYTLLYAECKRRGFNVANYGGSFCGLPTDLYNDWHPTPADRQLVVDRIESKGIVLLPRRER